MGSLTALVLATPLFGFSLPPPSPALLPAAPVTIQHGASLRAPGPLALPVPAALQLDDADGDEGEAAPDQAAAGDEGPAEVDDYAAQIRRRAEIAEIHKILGISTWASMGVTLLLGGFQYHNLYGTFSSLEDTPCVTGDAIFGQGTCSGAPLPHLISSAVTTALYSVTFALSLMMPDPDDLSEGDSDYASNLRTHKVLRWVHFVGMIAQLALGVVIANAEEFGMDRANDYGTLQALSSVHMGIGLLTYGAMTWAGALMVL